MIKTHPVKVEALGDGGNFLDDEPIYTLENFDEFAYSLEVKQVINADCWPEVARSIQDSLKRMQKGWKTKSEDDLEL